MKHAAMEFMEAFLREPLLMEESALRRVLYAMRARTLFADPPDALAALNQRLNLTTQNGIAVIPIANTLTYRDRGYYSYYFGTTYERIRQSFRQAASDQSVSAIVFDVASSGGLVEGCFDLVDDIYRARGAKPIYAVLNEYGLSAAYAIASAADRVIIPRTGKAGSVGVRMVHIDESAWESEQGLKYTEIYAGARKNDGTSHGPLPDEVLAIYQKQVNDLYDLFAETVARNRGRKAADIKAQESSIYNGKDAVAAGLADQVMSWNEAMMMIMKTHSQGGCMKSKLQALFGEQPKETVEQALKELGYGPLTGPIQTTDQQIEQIKTDAATAVKAETIARVKEILELCALAGMETMAAGLIEKGATVEEARKEIQEARAAESEKSRIRSTVSGTSTGEPNPLMEDAKKRAGIKS
jgi:signal peptide peptidase SppA